MKTLLRAVVILLIVHLVAALGGLAYAASHGAFQRDRLAAALTALRGHSPANAAATQPASQPASQPSDQPMTTSAPTSDLLADEVRRLELDRREREIADQWALIRAAQLQVLRDREAMEAARKDTKQVAEARESPEGGEGYKKELEYLQSIKPRMAKELLRQKKDADAVQIMMTLDPRVGRKIIDACKTSEERLWMGRLLDQLRQRNHDRAERLSAGAS